MCGEVCRPGNNDCFNNWTLCRPLDAVEDLDSQPSVNRDSRVLIQQQLCKSSRLSQKEVQTTTKLLARVKNVHYGMLLSELEME